MVTPYQQETLLLVTDQMSISLMLQWFIPDEMICHQYQTTMAYQDMQSHIGDKRINRHFYHTFLVWADKTWDSYVLSGMGYYLFGIWQDSSVSDHYIFSSNKVESS